MEEKRLAGRPPPKEGGVMGHKHARHMVETEPSMQGPGKTRCGKPVPLKPAQWWRSYVRDPEKVNCLSCLKWMGIPVRRNSSNNVAIKRNGLKIPYISIESLERPRPAPNYGDSPRPGPPYPWESKEMGCTGEGL